MKEKTKNVFTISYKLNVKKIKELLSDKNSPLNGFEKHVIQEGLKEILFGNGPINFISNIGIDVGVRDITPAMRQYLIEYELIEIDDTVDSKTGEVNIKHKN